jgi:hypothetical protein
LQPINKEKKDRNFPSITFERSQGAQTRLSLIMSALELIIVEKKYNLGQTLHLEFPHYINRLINNFFRFSQSCTSSVIPVAKLTNCLCETVCNGVEV